MPAAKRPTKSQRRPESSLGPFRSWLRGRSEQERTWPRRLLRYAIVAVPASFLLGMLLFGMAYAFVDVPEPSDIATARSGVVVDSKERRIGGLSAEADRIDIAFNEMPTILRDAVLAAEDDDFYRHPGISIPSIIRAAFANVTGLGVRQGGSTITQQYVKNAYVGRERTLWRKMKEAVVALKLERSWAKDEILAAYLNTIYFGRGAYGVEAAARTYFGIAAKDLNPAQAALLAGIIKAPETYEPSRAPEAARGRRDAVLRRMADLGKLSVEQASAAAATPVKVRSRSASMAATDAGAHFLEDVRRWLVARFGADRVYRGGLVVRTTLDLDLQRVAEASVREVLDRPDDPEAALVSIDTETGGVLAMVGARTFAERPFNLATQGRRQSGSAFKPFVLATALEEDLSIRTQFEAPAKITLKTGFEPWTVSNYDRRSYGRIDLESATEFSVNTVFAQLILKVGPKRTVETAHRMGIVSKLSAVPSLTLGTSVVSPLELTGAYTAFATGGMHADPYLVNEVKDATGETLYRAEQRPMRVLTERVAATAAHALTQVVEQGTGSRADLGSRPVGGKTGTTEDHIDAWFIGFTRRIATGVWMGFPEGGRTMERVRGVAVTGGSFPAQIWRAYMERATEGAPVEGFGEPDLSGDTPSPSPVPSPTPTPSTTVVPSQPPAASPTPKPAPTKTKPPDPSPTPTATATGSPGGGG
jgi:penicillin-binding protein 1A